MKQHNFFNGILWLIGLVLAPVVLATTVFGSGFTNYQTGNFEVTGLMMFGVIDMFNTRTMMRMLEQLKPAKTWLRDTIFNVATTHTSEYIDIDVQKGSRRIAVYVHPLHEGKMVDREGFKTFSYKAPYTKEKMVTTAQLYLNRQAGNTIYTGGETPTSRAQQQLGKDLRSLNQRIDRLEEVQAAEAIQTGKVTCIGEGINQIVDYQMSATHLPVLTGTDKWSDHTNSDPNADLSNWSLLIQQDSGLVPNRAIMGIDAAQDYLRNDKVLKDLDTRRLQAGQIDVTALAENGVQFLGDVRRPGLTVELYTYVEWYYDVVAKVEKPLINPDKVIFYNTGARAERHYGAIEDLDALSVTARFAKSWTTKDPSARWVMVQSAPLTAPHQIDAFLTATVR